MEEGKWRKTVMRPTTYECTQLQCAQQNLLESGRCRKFSTRNLPSAVLRVSTDRLIEFGNVWKCLEMFGIPRVAKFQSQFYHVICFPWIWVKCEEVVQCLSRLAGASFRSLGCGQHADQVQSPRPLQGSKDRQRLRHQILVRNEKSCWSLTRLQQKLSSHFQLYLYVLVVYQHTSLLFINIYIVNTYLLYRRKIAEFSLEAQVTNWRSFQGLPRSKRFSGPPGWWPWGGRSNGRKP